MPNHVAYPALVVLSLSVAPMAAQSAPRAMAPDTSWVTRSALYEVFVQDFSSKGTFRGVIDGLDRIQSTGADVIWLMPIHPIGVANRKGRLGSPYAVKDYRAINPTYGNAADFQALVDAAHRRGMKLILDWVPDHTSPDHAWVKQHPEYYIRNHKGEPSVPREPDGKLTDWTDVVQLDYKNPALRREMIGTMQYWLEEFGIDGFRMDVAGFLPYDYWRDAIPQLRGGVGRPILLLAEWGDPELHRLGFDLTYAWDTYDRLKAVWQGAPASSFIEGEMTDMAAIPQGGMRMRFTTNHDKTAWDDPPTRIFNRGAGTRAAFVAAALLPGRPLLYNGQEVESPQKLPLFERDTVQWKQPQAREARDFYSRVIRLTRTEPSLLGRDLRPVETNASKDVIAYGRGDLVVLVNTRPKHVKLAVADSKMAGSRDLLSGRTLRGDTISLPGHGAMVLKRP